MVTLIVLAVLGVLAMISALILGRRAFHDSSPASFFLSAACMTLVGIDFYWIVKVGSVVEGFSVVTQ